jgi:hypothetical protein
LFREFQKRKKWCQVIAFAVTEQANNHAGEDLPRKSSSVREGRREKP